MSHKPDESLEKFRARVERLERPSLTSPLFTRAGWPLLIVGLLLWLIEVLLPGSQFLIALLGLILSAIGGWSVAMSFVSAHSEGVEVVERDKLIRERNVISRCLYLEGNVADSKGKVGRCRLYEFDMVEYPYCIYCKEYTPSKGKPDV